MHVHVRNAIHTSLSLSLTHTHLTPSHTSLPHTHLTPSHTSLPHTHTHTHTPHSLTHTPHSLTHLTPSHTPHSLTPSHTHLSPSHTPYTPSLPHTHTHTCLDGTLGEEHATDRTSLGSDEVALRSKVSNRSQTLSSKLDRVTKLVSGVWRSDEVRGGVREEDGEGKGREREREMKGGGEINR